MFIPTVQFTLVILGSLIGACVVKFKTNITEMRRRVRTIHLSTAVSTDFFTVKTL